MILAVLPIEDSGITVEVVSIEIHSRFIEIGAAIDGVAVGIVHAKPRGGVGCEEFAADSTLVIHAADEATFFAEIWNGSREVLIARCEDYG